MKRNKDKGNSEPMDLYPSARGFLGQPQNVTEQINKYGTYNIQPTNDSDNSFPKIAQGLARPTARQKMKKEKEKSRDIF